MEYVSRAWKDPVWSKVISAGIIGVLVWIVQNYLGNTAEAAYAKAFTPVQIPHWVIWLWLAVTIVLTAFVGRALLNKRKSNGDAANAIRAERDPKIEIVTGQTTPYSVTEVQAGHVLSTVRIGIKNTGGKTLSNCKIFIEKICPSTNSPGGTSMLLEGTGFQLRQEDPEKFVDVAAHWDHHDRFRFSTPISGGLGVY